MPNEDKEFVMSVIDKMNKQDNRSTAMPYYYVIRDLKKAISAEGYSDKYQWIKDGEAVLDWDDDVEKYLGDYYPDELEDREDWETFDYLMESLGHEKWFFTWEPVYKNFFLTEDACKEHLRLNHYHYHDDATSYVMHAWRSPEFKAFLESVARLVGMEHKVEYGEKK